MKTTKNYFIQIWKKYINDFQISELLQLFSLYLIVTTVIYLNIPLTSKTQTLNNLLKHSYVLIILFIFISTLLIITNMTKSNKNLLTQNIFGLLQKLGNILLTNYGILFWFILFLIIATSQYQKLWFCVGLLFFMSVIKLFLAALKLHSTNYQPKFK